MRQRSPYFPGLKSGDFIQFTDNFGDIFFEVITCGGGTLGEYWGCTYATYAKYGSLPSSGWKNSASNIRAVIPAEMAIPVMVFKRLRFMALIGQYDPIYGFAPVGKPLRNKED